LKAQPKPSPQPVMGHGARLGAIEAVDDEPGAIPLEVPTPLPGGEWHRRLGPVRDRRGGEMKPRLESLAMDVVGGTPAEFAAHQAEETRRWAALIRRRGIRLE
jgi:hypothetical protein